MLVTDVLLGIEEKQKMIAGKKRKKGYNSSFVLWLLYVLILPADIENVMKSIV